MTIVKDTAGKLYRVIAQDPAMPQAWLGYPVKRTKGGFAIKAGCRDGAPWLIRKAGCTIVLEN